MNMLVYFYTNELKSLFAVLFTPLYCRCLTDFQYLLSHFSVDFFFFTSWHFRERNFQNFFQNCRVQQNQGIKQTTRNTQSVDTET